MFTKTNGMSKNGDNDSPSVNLLGVGTVIKGNIKSEGDIRIDGSLKGTITSKGKVVIEDLDGAIESAGQAATGLIS